MITDVLPTILWPGGAPVTGDHLPVALSPDVAPVACDCLPEIFESGRKGGDGEHR